MAVTPEALGVNLTVSLDVAWVKTEESECDPFEGAVR